MCPLHGSILLRLMQGIYSWSSSHGLKAATLQPRLHVMQLVSKLHPLPVVRSFASLAACTRNNFCPHTLHTICILRLYKTLLACIQALGLRRHMP